jgi:hypothetical protein
LELSGRCIQRRTFKTVRTETKNSDGTRTEIGKEYTNSGTTDSPVWEEARSWNFKFDDNWNLVEGTETREDGVTVQFGANWIIKGETFDTSKLAGNELDPTTKIVSKADYSNLDTSQELTYADLFDFTTTVNGQEVKTAFAIEEKFDWGGSETIYYNASGDIVGRAHANGSSLPQSLHFETGEYQFIAFVELRSDGVHYRHETADPNVTGGIIETGVDVNDQEARSWEFKFDEDYNFKGGSETKDGLTSEVNQFGQTTSKTVDTSNLSRETTKSVLDGLPSSFVIDPDANVTGDEYTNYLEQTYPGGTETYFFMDDGTSLGRSVSWSDTYWGGSGTDYFDADDEYIGGTFSDGTYTSTRFEVKDADGNRIETGTETRDGTVERSWEFKFDEDFNLLSGTETRSDGTTTTYGANWEISGESVALSSLTALTANDFNAEVIKFDANATDVASGLVKLSDVYDFSVTGSSTLSGYYKKEDFDWSDGYEITYFDSSGQTLGRKMVDIYVDSGGNGGSAYSDTAVSMSGPDQSGSSSSSSTTFAVTVVGGKFLIDGTSQKALTLDEGKTYKFDLSDSSVSIHPFKIKADGSEYTTGVVVNGTQGDIRRLC